MKNKTSIGTILFSVTALLIILTYSCKKETDNNNVVPLTKPGPNVTDIEGNIYHSVILGTQTWLVENLNVSHYRNGDTIPNILDTIAWSKLKTGAYCDFQNIKGYSSTYGKLYNWYAVTDNRNITPIGWHIPTDNEWEILIDYLGGADTAGGKLKETGTQHWYFPNKGATNVSGFTALGSSFRGYDGIYYEIKINEGFWSSTELDTANAYYRFMYYSASSIRKFNGSKNYGYSIRCIKD